MANQELLEGPGNVRELSPNAACRVKLENDHETITHAAGKICMSRIRALAGDEVLVDLTLDDLSKGRITDRFK
jgi:translation initiation factor IF-1